MNLIFSMVLITLFCFLAWYIISPFFQESSAIPFDNSQNDLERKKVVLLRQIKELDMDHHIGNISDDDYTRNRQILKKEISQIIIELKKAL